MQRRKNVRATVLKHDLCHNKHNTIEIARNWPEIDLAKAVRAIERDREREWEGEGKGERELEREEKKS